jgi:hypothetical protein
VNWEFIIALVVAIPLILLPAALIWYFNTGRQFWKFKKSEKQISIASGTDNRINGDNGKMPA